MAMTLAVGATFGSSFLFVKLLVAEATPAQITAWRLLFGGAAVLVLLAWRGSLEMPAPSLLAKATMLAVLDSVLPNTLLAWAQIRIDSGIAAVLISSMPMFTVLFAMALPGRDSLSRGKLFGLVLGVVGVAVLVGADAESAANGAPSAHIAVLLAAMSQAAAVVFARSLLAREDALTLSGIKLGAGAAMAMVMVAVLDGGAAVPSMGSGAWGLLIVLGVVSNGLGRTMYLSLIASAGSVRASVVAYVVPAVSVFLGWLVLGERLGISGGAGLVLIAAGMGFVTHGEQLARVFDRLRHMGQTRTPTRGIAYFLSIPGLRRLHRTSGDGCDGEVSDAIADAKGTLDATWSAGPASATGCPQ